MKEKLLLSKEAQPAFNWDGFTLCDFFKSTSVTRDVETMTLGFAHFTSNDRRFFVDIQYENYGYDQRGFDLEVYEENADGSHGKWLGSIKDIRSAANYTAFVRRAERLLVRFTEAAKPVDNKE